MALEAYRRKRDFRKTSEPSGTRAKKRARGAPRFVVQKHAATRLHYDFRLEHAGVLLSWAVPKGPSLDPRERRLAVRVEDHPLDYAAFEGTIPEGEYGAGAVIVWDRGTWQPHGDPAEGLRRGKLEFELDGEKLHGRWTLVRMNADRERSNGAKQNWLLIKGRDEAARTGGEAEIVERLPKSVGSGRTIDDVERGTRARRGASTKRIAKAAGAPSWGRARVDVVEGAVRAPLPKTIEPELATLVSDAPTGDEWLHEIKFDGFRILCRLDRGDVRLLTRRGNDWTSRFPSVAAAAKRLRAKEAFLDGEVVVLQPSGRSSFQDLQNSMNRGRDEDIAYCVFDLLHLDGFDLRGAALEARKRALETLLRGAPSALRFSSHTEGAGKETFREACRLALEGIVSKRRDRPYVGGRGTDWVKVRCEQRQELVIGGFTDPQGSRVAFGALLLGVHDDEGRLRFAGKVGTGFDERTLRSVHRRLREIETLESPFANPPLGGRARGVHWVKPTLLAEIEFTEWTKDGSLRHPVFLGLRDDKPAKDVVREVPRTPREVGAKPRATARPKKSRAADSQEVVVAGVRLTHPGRVVYPEQGITKLELAQYYQEIARWILPHVSDRPLALVRCPEGRGGQCFYQKHLRDLASDAVRSVEIEEESGRSGAYPVVDSVAGLVSLVQMGVLEIHPWGARADDLEHPDRVIFDLDPSADVSWERVVDGARLVHECLERLGLKSFVKTTGGKGLHVVAPLGGRSTWDELREFAREVAEIIVRSAPSLYTATMSKEKRRGRIFVDWFRNGRGATAVAAYSTRARPGAPVSTPLRWDELDHVRGSDAFTVRTLPARLARWRPSATSNPWHGFAQARQLLPHPEQGQAT
jgi:bifunctional non-homologous end joining protein LigD